MKNRIRNILLYLLLLVASPAVGCFYTHNNHLGSAAWITRKDGQPVQYLHYLPYGHLLANQMPFGYDERFKFTGKERDAESGYDSFGARYYISPFFHWSSVDPLSGRSPGISPYAYCLWNPIKYVDPDGRDAVLITFPNYRAMYRGYKIPHTGHSGVLLIDNKTGLTKYYEYGRYDRANVGVTLNKKVPDVTLKDGSPTLESLNNVLSTISRQSGDNGNIEGAYIKSENFKLMNAFAEKK